MNSQEILDLVSKHLAGARFADVKMHVEEDAIRQDGDWWYVPLKPVKEFPRRDQYYAFLADLEEEIDVQENVNVLLVPSS